MTLFTPDPAELAHSPRVSLIELRANARDALRSAEAMIELLYHMTGPTAAALLEQSRQAAARLRLVHDVCDATLMHTAR